MKMNDYQKRARKTAIYPGIYKITYPALGLAGEAGEVCGKIKKHLRGDIYKDHLTDEQEFLKIMIKHELGDVLWYVANLASDLDLTLDDIATANIDKLRDRVRRNVLQGDGDDR